MGGLYENESLLPILLVTGLLGGGAAWMAGRALADTWRPFWHVVVYMILLAMAVRFIHFALFEGHLLSLPSYLADAAFLVLVGSLAWRVTRTSRMVTQYYWLYERTSPFSWRERTSRPAN